VHDDEFEWDDAKAGDNLAKHGVTFDFARRVFDDVFAFERLDADNAEGETRYVIMGAVEGVILVVVYTERNERTRLISARKATKHEQRAYYRSPASD
jgi:uncharacterized DUF497 family protein